ncbi:hypothetical protein ABPG74_013801 [Tetrahymena malaccensis]
MALQRQETDSQSYLSLQTQADDVEIILNNNTAQRLPKEISDLLQQRIEIKQKMKKECKSNCCGKEEYISFDNHINMLEVSYYKQFIWPVCKEGLSLNLQMHEICKKLWKLNYRDYQNYLEATYIFI